MSQSEFTKEAGISYRPIHRLFGSLESFCTEAGFQLHPSHKQKIPDKSLFDEFYRIIAQIGHIPSYVELRSAKYSHGTFVGRFGNYSDFKLHALQYGIDHKLIEPAIAEQELAKPSRHKDKGISYEKLNDRPVLGPRINFRGLLHAPIT